MNKFLESVYAYSPVCLQDVYCSTYGLKLYKERYTRPWDKYYNQLLATQFFDEDKINEIQVSNFKIILKHALVHTPYYKERKADYNILGIIDKSLEEIRNIPILEKDVFRQDPDLFLSTNFNKKDLVSVNTSGTTGTPLAIRISQDGRKLNYAFFARSKNWAGVEGFPRSITLAGRTIVPIGQEGPPYWRKNFVFRNTLFSSYHLSDHSMVNYVDQIRKIRPFFIDSYPSSIYAIARYMNETGVRDISVRAVITSAETLLDHQRQEVEKAFQCKVFDQYGSAEQVVFASQCREGNYHINPEYGFLEVVDRNGNPVPNGEIGEFVCTGFTNPAMPLIRYKIGDMGVLSDEKCTCGIKFPLLSKIYGRNDDVLITPDGRYIGRLDPVFKGVCSTIKETQIVQEKPDQVKILIVRDVKYKEWHGEYIVMELKKRLGDNVHYQVIYVENIPRTERGKFRPVVRNFK